MELFIEYISYYISENVKNVFHADVCCCFSLRPVCLAVSNLLRPLYVSTLAWRGNLQT